MPESQLFRLNDFLENEEVFHLARTTINSQKDLIYHHHDYVEIFWIKEGSGKHLVNGQEIPIQQGSLWMIRPEDRHTFKMAAKSTGLVITNIAFAKDDLNYFRNRYFKDSYTYFWETGEIPFHTVLNREQLSDISNLSDNLLIKERSYLHLDHVLLHIFEMLTEENFNYEAFPHWLSHALKQYSTPKYFNSGVPGFVKLTGRSADHVNRVIKSYMRQTLTETINKLRLEFASKQLALTNTPIKIITAECGYASLSYFHRLFKSKYGISPKEYRERNKKVF